MTEHVIDSALWDKTPRYKWRRKEVEQVYYKAKRYILTDDASARAGEITTNIEAHLIRNHQFAIPPYPVTYVEMNSHLFLDQLGRAIYNPDDLTQDERVGYLIIRRTTDAMSIYTFSRSLDGQAGPSAFVYRKGGHLASGVLIPPELGPPDYAKLAVLLGTTIHAQDEPPPERKLTNIDGIRFWASIGHAFREIIEQWHIEPMYPDLQRFYKEDLFRMSAGDLRNVLVLLLILNQPKIVHVAAQDRRSGIRKGKRVVYAAHNTVNIELGRKKKYIKLFRYPVDRSSPRRHSVCGHFVHYHIAENCIHDWPSFPEMSEDDVPRWTCRRCGGKRVWRSEFMRGDAGRGFVTKEYAVK